MSSYEVKYHIDTSYLTSNTNARPRPVIAWLTVASMVVSPVSIIIVTFLLTAVVLS